MLGYLKFLIPLWNVLYKKGKAKDMWSNIKPQKHLLKKRVRATSSQPSKEFSCKLTFSILFNYSFPQSGHRLTPSCHTFSCPTPGNVPMNITYELKAQVLSSTLGNSGFIPSKVAWDSNQHNYLLNLYIALSSCQALLCSLNRYQPTQISLLTAQDVWNFLQYSFMVTRSESIPTQVR